MIAKGAKRATTPRSRNARGTPARVQATVSRTLDRVKFIPLPTPLEAGGRTYKKITFTIVGERRPMTGPFTTTLQRGVYCSFLGAPALGYAQYYVIDAAGAIAASVDTVPTRRLDTDPVAPSWNEHAPSRHVWLNFARVAHEILGDGGDVPYLGCLPYPGVGAGLARGCDPMEEAPTETPPPPISRDEPGAIVRHQQLPPGLSVAPFRGYNGEILVVAIGQDGGLDAFLPITEIGTALFSIERPELPEGVRWAGKGPDHLVDVELDDRFEASKMAFLARYVGGASSHAKAALHVCPWRGRINRRAQMVAVVDACGCCHGLTEVASSASEAVDWSLAFLAEVRSEEEFYELPVGHAYDPAYRAELAARKAAATVTADA